MDSRENQFSISNKLKNGWFGICCLRILRYQRQGDSISRDIDNFGGCIQLLTLFY